MVWWILFILKYMSLYFALHSFCVSLLEAISFWTGRVSKVHVAIWPECMSFVIYLVLSNFV